MFAPARVTIAEFVPEACRSIKGRLISRGGTLSREMVREYFERRTRLERDTTDILASQSTTYQLLHQQVWRRLGLNGLKSESRLIDYGCGSDTQLAQLRRHGYEGEYVGYDLNSVGMSRIEARLGSLFTSRMPTGLFDIVCATNVLCYTSDIELTRVVDELANLTAPNSRVVVTEPAPKWYWEDRFDGLQLRLRNWGMVDELLRTHGFTPDIHFQIAAIRVAGKPFLPLAWSGIWQAASRNGSS